MPQLTSEQSTIVDHISSTQSLTLISAIAGSGKTTLLRAIADTIPHSHGLYLAYNNSIATSSKKKFPKSIDCRTVHSIAYQATVKPCKLSIGYFNPRDMSEPLSYNDKVDFIESFREFCLSEFIDMHTFVTTNSLPDYYTSLGDKYLNLMHTGKIACTHDFYLKLYHILLANGSITYEPFDLLLWDEIQDMAPVATKIFELLPAIRKIGVGDKFQSIYSFNHTVNYFELAPTNTSVFTMSHSFRVPDYNATLIDKFCKSYLDPNMSFIGIPITDSTITTRAYLTRTNSALIAKMIELNELNIPYSLERKPEEIFKLPLILCGLKYKGFISSPEYKHLQDDINEWYETPDLRMDYKSPISYIASIYSDDMQLKQATKLILRYGKQTILNTYESAKSHVKSQTNYTLCTAHASKGLEYDEVTISSDLNESIEDIITDIKCGKSLDDLTKQERESLNLYYVAVSRHQIKLHNAKYI